MFPKAATASEIARRIRDRLERKGISQRNLAKATLVHQSQVSRILNCRFRRPSQNVMRICTYLGVSTRRASRLNPRLSAAVADLWDGTPQHERTLVKLLKTLAEAGRRNWP